MCTCTVTHAAFSGTARHSDGEHICLGPPWPDPPKVSSTNSSPGTGSLTALWVCEAMDFVQGNDLKMAKSQDICAVLGRLRMAQSPTHSFLSLLAMLRLQGEGRPWPNALSLVLGRASALSTLHTDQASEVSLSYFPLTWSILQCQGCGTASRPSGTNSLVPEQAPAMEEG